MTLTALELKLWHKRWFPDFDGGHFENGPKQVVHPNFFLMASTFDIRGGPMNNKNLVSDSPGGGGGCTVTLSGPWTMSTMRFHRSLGIFVIIFTRFSLISQSILNRFSCNFAGTTCNYSGDCPEKFVKFERVFLKLLVRLVVNLLEYFKINAIRSQFRHQFSTVYHVILQAPLDGITATAL